MSSDPLAGWEMVAQAAELAQRGEDCALATVVWRQGPSSGQQGSRALVTAGGRDQRVDRRSVRRAGRHPRGAACDRRRRAATAAPRHARAVRTRARRDDRHPDRVPERGRDGGVHRAGRVDAAPRRRRSVADDSHAVRAGSGARMARRPASTARTSRRADARSPVRSWWWRRRATVTKKRSSTQ